MNQEQTETTLRITPKCLSVRLGRRYINVAPGRQAKTGQVCMEILKLFSAAQQMRQRSNRKPYSYRAKRA